MALSRIILRATAIVAGVLGALLLLSWVAVTWFFGGFHINIAKQALAPTARALDELGVQKICDDGDAGYGANNEPWYTVYYRVEKDEPAARKAVFESAAQGGFLLHEIVPYAGDTEYISAAMSRAGQTNAPGAYRITINTRAETALQCRGSADLVKAPAGGAIYEIRFSSSMHTS
ncbi:hypothetical protein AS850_14060 [Frondihabitans sp. 762G35]|uniref:hypothetical protein n=1 Tax=Frondihabitans sp. 762G35 TaxID=1446794 RepID=UPI000D219F05|nr:hypothetical protein [Frondihabitans sp. 762G35]ARC58205.1 hypothetical protein AS850_14060 [Frondihabitans sp. 762G35]